MIRLLADPLLNSRRRLSSERRLFYARARPRLTSGLHRSRTYRGQKPIVGKQLPLSGCGVHRGGFQCAVAVAFPTVIQFERADQAAQVGAAGRGKIVHGRPPSEICEGGSLYGRRLPASQKPGGFPFAPGGTRFLLALASRRDDRHPSRMEKRPAARFENIETFCTYWVARRAD